MSTDSKPVALIFGAGVNIGTALIKEFTKAGYRVAAVSRNTTAADAAGAHFSTSADLSNPSSIPTIFTRVRDEFNTFPSVIVWNAATRTPSPDRSNIFSVPVQSLEKDLAVAVSSPWAAANEAVKNWTEGQKGVFIYTGNIMAKGVFPHPDFTTLGTSKRAASYVIEAADAMYKAKGWR
jgi:NAD(P)-dependent dehydrogenase (short-subunit alcohol dehydrogenase family)